MTRRRPRISVLLAGGCATFLACSGQADAACSRSDVAFYLEKGFSHEQIVSLCGEPEASSEPMATSAPPRTEQGGAAIAPPLVTAVQPARSGPGQFLMDSINGYDIAVTQESIGYTRKDCFRYGPEDQFGFQAKVCPEVRYTINLKGLDVVDTGREFLFFGGGEIKVAGGIDRFILNGMEEVTEASRKLILKQVHADGNHLVIPVREGVPLERVTGSLKELAR